MALYLDSHKFALLASPDMKTWAYLMEITFPGAGECPDLFELPEDGDVENARWIF